MLDQFSRTELLLGREGMERLARAHVAVFGLGGVGGYAAEALVRSGGSSTAPTPPGNSISPNTTMWWTPSIP